MLKLFWELTMHVVERKLLPSQIFNMDETGFLQNSKAKQVIVVSGSKNIWSKKAETNFYLTLVACVAADGFAVPPLFLVPGKRLNRNVLDSCAIENAKIATADKGFMTSAVFCLWLKHFADSVPDLTLRPLLLVMDGCSSHYNKDIVELAITLW